MQPIRQLLQQVGAEVVRCYTRHGPEDQRFAKCEGAGGEYDPKAVLAYYQPAMAPGDGSYPELVNRNWYLDARGLAVHNTVFHDRWRDLASMRDRGSESNEAVSICVGALWQSEHDAHGALPQGIRDIARGTGASLGMMGVPTPLAFVLR